MQRYGVIKGKPRFVCGERQAWATAATSKTPLRVTFIRSLRCPRCS